MNKGNVEKLKFNKIQFEDVFEKEWESLEKNNILKFYGDKKGKKRNICTIYAPNGTGKTCFTKAIKSQVEKDNEKKKNQEDNNIEFEYNGKTYSNASDVFYTISDQNGRNIIQKDNNTYYLSDNQVKKQKLYDESKEELNVLIKEIKEKLKYYKITTKTSIDKNMENQNLLKIIEMLYEKDNSLPEDYYENYKNLKNEEIIDDEDKEITQVFLKEKDKKNTLNLLEEISNIKITELPKVDDAKSIERNNVAVYVLGKFMDYQKCIVCDNPKAIDTAKLKEDKQNLLEEKIQEIEDDNLKKLVTKLIKCNDNDYDKIKELIIKAIELGRIEIIEKIKNEIIKTKTNYERKINNDILAITNQSLYLKKYEELLKARDESENLISEFELIKSIIYTDMNKKLTIFKDGNQGYIINLNDDPIEDKEREKLKLSCGEQNFISLAFELLKAKANDKPIIIIDDPISSYDSIYREKIVFLITKLLEGKNTIILTHNLETIRLLDCTKSNSFNLYFLRNEEIERENIEEYGFIEINDDEKNLIIYLNKITKLLRDEIDENIEDKKLFYISILPFLRDYISITNGKNSDYDKLCKLMHGYKIKNQEDDIDKEINLKELFNKYLKVKNDVTGNEIIEKEKMNKNENDILISYNDIFNLDINNLYDIVNKDKYPLLNESLKKSICFLQLRLKVEETLYNKYIKCPYNEKEPITTAKIIMDAFKNISSGTREEKWKIDLMSKKIMINQFNHFETDFNIFQPSIDITNKTLKKEIMSINNILKEIKS